jgi:5-methylcytosine-specific restriction endonuclease McrA
MGGGLRHLMKRDKNRCHICHLKVEPGDASRDHLVPRSKGGSSAKANLALAHKWCNNARMADPTATRATPRGWRQ